MRPRPAKTVHHRVLHLQSDPAIVPTTPARGNRVANSTLGACAMLLCSDPPPESSRVECPIRRGNLDCRPGLARPLLVKRAVSGPPGAGCPQPPCAVRDVRERSLSLRCNLMRPLPPLCQLELSAGRLQQQSVRLQPSVTRCSLTSSPCQEKHPRRAMSTPTSLTPMDQATLRW